MGILAVIGVAELSPAAIVSWTLGIAMALAWAWCAFVGVRIMIQSPRGSQRDLGLTMLCLGIGGVWADQESVLPVTVPSV